MTNPELPRIDQHQSLELPATPKVLIEINGLPHAPLVLARTKEIMKAISAVAYTNSWPSEEAWKTRLPQWLVESMTSKTAEDRDKDPLLWHYASWIAAMKDRAWHWYSSQATEDRLSIVLEILGVPILYDALLYILHAQGVNSLQLQVTDDVYDA